MVRIPSNASFEFVVQGTEIEGRDVDGCDVQFPWETVARVHHRANVFVQSFAIDMFPVTNGQYASFVAASGYIPHDRTNWLRDWLVPGRVPPTAGLDRPVTWVDLVDASAFCAFYNKRLPNDWEWQYAAQGTDGRAYPWGAAWDPSRVPSQTTGPVRSAPPSVGGFPSGASPFGVQDMLGLVWQWTNEFTDAHTRAGLVRGGAYYRASTSGWYFPGRMGSEAVRTDTHGKLLLMDSSYDRHGTVGFRCVQDLIDTGRTDDA